MDALTVFDTDVSIDVLRGSEPARAEILAVPPDLRRITVVSAMELVVGARDSAEAVRIDRFVAGTFGAPLQMDEQASRLASAFVGKYALSHGLRIPDALVAAIVQSKGGELVTGNLRDFSFIAGLSARAPAYRDPRN